MQLGFCVQGYVNKFLFSFSVKGETWLINVKHSKKITLLSSCGIYVYLSLNQFIMLRHSFIRLMRNIKRSGAIFFSFHYVWMCPKVNGLLIACYNLIWRKLAVFLTTVKDAVHVPWDLLLSKLGWTSSEVK